LVVPITFPFWRNSTRLTEPSASLAEAAIKTLADDFEKNGAEVIQKVRLTDPATYMRVAYSLLPKDLLVTVTQDVGPLTAEERIQLKALLALIERANVQLPPAQVFTLIEDAIRPYVAKPIEAKQFP